MVENDTIELLRECDAGVKMGISSIEDVLKFVDDERFKKLLTKCRNEHEELQKEIQKNVRETREYFADIQKDSGF